MLGTHDGVGELVTEWARPLSPGAAQRGAGGRDRGPEMHPSLGQFPVQLLGSVRQAQPGSSLWSSFRYVSGTELWAGEVLIRTAGSSGQVPSLSYRVDLSLTSGGIRCSFLLR